MNGKVQTDTVKRLNSKMILLLLNVQARLSDLEKNSKLQYKNFNCFEID